MTHAAAVERENGIDAHFAGRLGDRRNGFSLDIDFTAPLQGITALFGPSGCGKTSLLRCIAGLNRLPGHLLVGGEAWQDEARGVYLPPHRRAVGYVFQEASLFPHLSVAKNLLYGAKRAGTETRNGAPSFDDIVALLGIDHLLERAPEALSGGERQRVALGRALLSRPRVLLMDEPLSALDRMTKEEILPYFEALPQALGLPILYVSHDIAEVSRLADRMVLIAKGRKVAEGPLQALLERLDLSPETGRFEAGVVVSARVAGHDPDFRMTRLELGGQPLSLPQAEVAVGEDVRLRIRARDVGLATQRPTGISFRNVLAGTIQEIVEEPETAFAETLVEVGGQRLRARLTREAVAELGLIPGTPVFALIKSVAFDRRALSAAHGEAREESSVGEEAPHHVPQQP